MPHKNRKKTTSKRTRKKPPDTSYCKQVVYSEPPDISGIHCLEKKCLMYIGALRNSLIYFEDLFSGIHNAEEISKNCSDRVYYAVNDIESIVRNNQGSDNIVELSDGLRDEASFLQDSLDSTIESIVPSFDCEDSKLSESIEHKLEEEFEFVRKVGYDLYHVMIGAA